MADRSIALPPVTRNPPVLCGEQSPTRNSDQPTHLDYRPDIDGLRAIAVLAVIGFHAFPTYVSGGFVGVDVFFVISGYLISTILFTGMERGSFTLLGFYMRRVRRIFPALIVVLIACLLVGWLTLFAFEYTQLGKHVAGSAGFISNFLLWNEAGYFDKAAETKPLLHIWSLGIEEQFYIVWPLLLYLTWKCKTRSLTLNLLVVLVLASFVLNIHTVTSTPAEGFYSPFTRSWELLAGAILAYISLKRPTPQEIFQKQPRQLLRMLCVIFAPTSTINNPKATAGLLLIGLAILMVDRTKGFPGWWALLPVVGTYLVISAGRHAWINDRLLGTRILVAIGLISYPLYLWHWPLLSFVRIIESQNPSAEAAALAILASFVLASLTYFLVEKPIRSGKLPKSFVPLLVSMSIVGIAGYGVYREQGFPFRQHRGIDDLGAAMKDFDHGDRAAMRSFRKYSVLLLGKPGSDETVLVGDSTMQQYIPRVRRLAEHSIDLDKNRIMFAVWPGCLPIPEIAWSASPSCAEVMDELLPALNARAVKTVVFASLWTNHFTDVDFYLRSHGPDMLLRKSEIVRDQAFRNFSALISGLVKSGKRVFVILETPLSPVFQPERLLPTGWNRLLGKPRVPENSSRALIEKYNGEINGRLRTVAEAAGARIINPMDFLCDKESCFLSEKDDRTIYYDSDHLRASFVREHATWIDQIFWKSESTPQ
jgi:peptidoglycan/LPS O-acetylase OafA/YrhL